MRIVVSGYYGCGNTGDEAILAGMLVTFREADPDLEVTVVSGDPEQTRRTHGVDAVPRMRPGPLWRALRAADGLVSGGGGLLQDRTSARPVAYYAGVMGLARAARRPYVIHTQGLGPIHRRTNRRLAAMALRGAAHVSLRDEGSVALARHLGVRRPIEVTADPALALEPRRRPGDHVLVAVRRWDRDSAHLEAIRTALGEIADTHPIVALPMHEPMDREPSAAVVAGVRGAEVVAHDLGLDARLDLIGSAALVVGMRLHALILAMAAGTPAVAISYDPKVEAFARRAAIPVAGSIDAPPDVAAIATAMRSELAALAAGRDALVERMRDEVRASTARALAALRDAGGVGG